MAHELNVIQTGIVRLAFIGNVSKVDVEAFIQDVQPHLNSVPAGGQLHMVIDGSRDGKLSAEARRAFTEFGNDPRFGLAGVYHVTPFNRVFATFLMKATGRQNIRFFNTEAEAVAWLNENMPS